MKDYIFRAWDKTNKKMVPVTHMTWDKNGYITEINQEMPKWFELMQHTGCFDQAGKDIFAGDIIEYLAQDEDDPSGIDYPSRVRRIREIKYDNLNDFQEIPSQCVVLGHVYEYPDLITNYHK